MSKRYKYGLAVTRANSAGVETVSYYSTIGGPAGAAHAVVAADTFLDGRLKQPGLAALHLWGERRTRGPRDVGNCVFVLENADGGLDAFVGYAFDGRDCFVWREEVGVPTSAAVIFRGVLEQPEVTANEVRMIAHDFAHLFDKPIARTTYLGDNVAPNGLEGGADMAGRFKPRNYWAVKNVEPVLVNATRLIYQLSDRQLSTGGTNSGYNNCERVSDRGVALVEGANLSAAELQTGGVVTVGTSANATSDDVRFTSHTQATGDKLRFYPSGAGVLPAPLVANTDYYGRVINASTITLHPTQADAIANTNKINLTSVGTLPWSMYFNATAPGRWDYCYDATLGSFIRLGSAPVGKVTANFTNDKMKNAGTYTPNVFGSASLIQFIAAEAITGTTVSLVATYDANMTNISSPHFGGSTESGVWLGPDDTMTYLEAINQLAEETLSGWYYLPGAAATRFDIKLIQLVDPIAGTVALEINSTNIQLQGDAGTDPTLERVLSSDSDRGVPVYRAKWLSGRNYNVMTPSELAGSIVYTDAAVPFVSSGRTHVKQDTAILTQWPRSQAIEVMTGMSGGTAGSPGVGAAAYVAKLAVALYGVRRDMFTVDIPVEVAIAAAIVPSSVVRVTYPRFGLNAGKKFLVIGMQLNYEDGTVTLFLWG